MADFILSSTPAVCYLIANELTGKANRLNKPLKVHFFEKGLCVSLQGEARIYMEPERKVVSRSADECVVALCDQW